jgi:hypothetical protein
VAVGGVGHSSVVLAGGVAATVGFAVFAANLVGVVVRHGPESLRLGIFGGSDEDESRDADRGEQFP